MYQNVNYKIISSHTKSLLTLDCCHLISERRKSEHSQWQNLNKDLKLSFTHSVESFTIAVPFYFKKSKNIRLSKKDFEFAKWQSLARRTLEALLEHTYHTLAFKKQLYWDLSWEQRLIFVYSIYEYLLFICSSTYVTHLSWTLFKQPASSSNSLFPVTTHKKSLSLPKYERILTT